MLWLLPDWWKGTGMNAMTEGSEMSNSGQKPSPLRLQKSVHILNWPSAQQFSVLKHGHTRCDLCADAAIGRDVVNVRLLPSRNMAIVRSKLTACRCFRWTAVSGYRLNNSLLLEALPHHMSETALGTPCGRSHLHRSFSLFVLK